MVVYSTCSLHQTVFNVSFFFDFSITIVGDEADGYDEIIYPCDYMRSGIISDDEMYDLMVKELPEGVQLTALVDACHSGNWQTWIQ